MKNTTIIFVNVDQVFLSKDQNQGQVNQPKSYSWKKTVFKMSKPLIHLA